MKTGYLKLGFLVLSLLPAVAYRKVAAGDVRIDGDRIAIEFNQSLHSRVTAKFEGKEIPLGDFSPSESLKVSGNEISDFNLKDVSKEDAADAWGSGRRYILTGEAASIRKVVAVTVYDEFPAMACFEVRYTNTGNSDLSVDGWTNQMYSISSRPEATEPAFWSYLSGSYESRPDWLRPLQVGFKQENFLGMNDTDYGGGTPVVDVWRRDAGLAVGHLEMVPKLVSLPVARPDSSHATVAVSFRQPQTLKPGATLATLRTFVAVHQGDYFQTLVDYRRAMVKQGIRFQPPPADAFAPIWCAWGYGRNFKPGQVYGALPVVKKLGFRWVTLDDGWQTAEGDWYLNRQKFPNGDRDIRVMVDKIHSEGFKAQLWWAPLSVDPGTDLITKHPEQLLLNLDGTKRKISWWDAWYLCPADPAVIEYHKNLITRIMKEWDFDGLKLDGQHMNGAPPCYNPSHHHSRPEESVEAVPAFFKALFDTARSIKPDALVEFCPCGTAYSFFTMPYMNMSVASDPKSSWQVRSKGKTLKALLNNSAAYFGDHVEMSEGGDDFASTLGVGGVVGTNFTWPVGSAKKSKLELTPQKEKIWEKWVGLYNKMMLSRGEYLGALYDIGFDKPEAHAIRKDGRMYYAFYAPQWQGQLELRGLKDQTYRLIDYESGTDLGRVQGPVAMISADFRKHLLVEARPE